MEPKEKNMPVPLKIINPPAARQGTVASSRQPLLSLQARSRQEIHSPLVRDRR